MSTVCLVFGFLAATAPLSVVLGFTLYSSFHEGKSAMPYQEQSEKTARVFAIRALTLLDFNNPQDRKLAERYKKASLYLYSRVSR